MSALYDRLRKTLPIFKINPDYLNADRDHLKKRTLKSPKKNSYLITFMTLLNAAIGLSIYELPHSINQAGYLFAVLIGLFIMSLEHYCVAMLFRIKNLIAREKVSDYESYEDSVYYCVSLGPSYIRRLAKPFKYMLKVMLVGYPLGLGTLNVVHVSSLLTQVSPLHSATETSIRYYVLGLTILLMLLNCIRDVTVLSIFTQFSIVLTILSMGLILYQIAKEKMLLTLHFPFGKAVQIPVFVSSVMLSYEAISSVITSEEDMEHSDNLQSTLSILISANILAQGLYLAMGVWGYLKYGVRVRANILSNLHPDAVTDSLKVVICTYSLISYPQQCYPIFNVAWYHGIEQYEIINKSRYLLLYEYMFRIVISSVTVAIAYAVPRFESVLQIIGSVCIPNLIFVFPAVMEYTYSWRSSSMKGEGIPVWTQAKDAFIITLGLFIVFGIGPFIVYNTLVSTLDK